MKISNLIIGLVLVGLFAGVFGLFFSGMATNYSNTYNESNFDSYDQITTIQSQTERIDSGLDADKTDSSLTDLVGGFLKKGFAVLKITFESFDLFDNMARDAGTQINTQTGVDIQWLIIPLVLVAFIIFLFLIISVLTGRDV